MRRPRLKLHRGEAQHHLTNRTVGMPDEMPFGPAEKEQLIVIVNRLIKVYTITVASLTVMDNHVHLIVCVPPRPPSLRRTAKRWNRHQRARLRRRGRKPSVRLDPSDPRCKVIAERLRDISWFMKQIQEDFTDWYNKTRGPERRRGSLWAGRFRSVLLQRGLAFRRCFLYLALNPARAGLEPGKLGDYPFHSWGIRCRSPGSGLARGMLGHLRRNQDVRDPDMSDAELVAHVEQAAAALLNADRLGGTGADRGHPTGSTRLPFLLLPDQRVAYWGRSTVVGDRDFVADALDRSGRHPEKTGRSPVRALERVGGPHADLWAYPPRYEHRSG